MLASASASFALPNCPSDQTKLYHNCLGKYTYADGSNYIGEFKDGLRHGQGTYTFASGQKYVGEWKDGKRNGKGTNTFPNGEKYVGEFKGDKRDGKGTYTFKNGENYVGEWLEDKRNGQGINNFPNGQKYVGEWIEGKKNGKGFYIWPNGKADLCKYTYEKHSNCSGSNAYDVAPILTGEFRQLTEIQRRQIQASLKSMDLYSSTIDGKWGVSTFSGIASYAVLNLKTVNINNIATANTLFQKIISSNSLETAICAGDELAKWDNCIGEFTYPDGGKYVGEFMDGTRNGKGTYIFVNGEKYVGEYKDGIRNGQGTFTYAEGDEYVGGFKDGKRNGQGTYTYANGQKYVGEYKDDFANGQGTYTWPSGQKYVGEHKKSKANGQGTWTFSNGDVYVGDFKDDKFHGQGVYSYVNGSKYVGEYKEDKKNGEGIFTWPNGDRHVGEYRDGKRNGKGTATYANGDVEKGIWKNDEFQYAQASPEVVEPDDPTETREVASGTGFYVSDEGHIITNYHVIDGCMDMKVHTKGRVIPTLRIADDKQNDLALLKISEKPNYVFALSNDSPFSLQEIVVAGFPFGDSYSSSLKFTQGIVSSLTGIGDNYSEMQIDAALQPGNSGGPIIDEYGNIIGVAVAKLDAKYTIENFGVIPENTNFGIKASAARNLLEGNQVPLKIPNTDLISKRDLSRLATDGTVYLTCWMTSAQLELMKSKKVMFGNLD